jgi:phage/plasmid-like protein (TIGR03299 family)
MSHELETRNGKVSMAYAGEVPWHGLGKQVPNDVTPLQMLKAAGLDWKVRKIPLSGDVKNEEKPTQIPYRLNSGGEMLVRIHSDGSRPTRSDVLTILPNNTWNPIQNEEAFTFFNDFCAAGEMEMHTAGSLQGGKHVWALAKIKGCGFDLFGGDRTEGYILFSNPHVFGKTTEIRTTDIRVVCNNTINLALEGEAKRVAKFNHRRKFNPDAAKIVLGVATERMARYKETAAFLGAKLYTADDLITYFNKIFPKTSDARNDHASDSMVHSANAKMAMSVVDQQPGAGFAPGSWWNAFNAVSYLTDHKLGISADTRTWSAWFGVNAAKKVEALRRAVEMAKAS